MSKNFSLRLPPEMEVWLTQIAKARGVSKAQIVLDGLALQMQDSGNTNAIQPQIPEPPALKAIMQDTCSTLMQDTCNAIALQLQDSLAPLVNALKETTQALQLAHALPPPPVEAPQSIESPKADEPQTPASAPPAQSEAPPIAKPEGPGKPGNLYEYEGKQATLREHILEVFPTLTQRDIDRSRNNINRTLRKLRNGEVSDSIKEVIAQEFARIKEREEAQAEARNLRKKRP